MLFYFIGEGLIFEEFSWAGTATSYLFFMTERAEMLLAFPVLTELFLGHLDLY